MAVHGSTSICTDASSSSWKFVQIDQGGCCSWMATAVIKKFTAEYGCSRINVDHQRIQDDHGCSRCWGWWTLVRGLPPLRSLGWFRLGLSCVWGAQLASDPTSNVAHVSTHHDVCRLIDICVWGSADTFPCLASRQYFCILISYIRFDTFSFSLRLFRCIP